MNLVLWDIDRTLLYVGNTDRLVYRETFQEVVGRAATSLPARGTGVTMPLAVRELLTANAVPETEVERFADLIVDRLPDRLEAHREELVRHGTVMPGAVEALAAVHQAPDLIPTVVTGNLRASAEIKLAALSLIQYVDIPLGGYASDSAHRPDLVGIAQSRAAARHGIRFDAASTVIIGDSRQDVITGLEGGAKIIGVASGTTSAQQLSEAGAHYVLPDLRDPEGLLSRIRALTNE
ncbi:MULTISPECIES: HAD family hydrolase [unclassified Streptomyces]|uniref:HAD family hydrolase n=1 Tax=unclassified Streptomyces TaxID=2593676 RepID=UPI0037AFF9B6